MCQALCIALCWPINNLSFIIVCLPLSGCTQQHVDLPLSVTENPHHSSRPLFSSTSKGGELSAVNSFGFSETAHCQGLAQKGATCCHGCLAR